MQGAFSTDAGNKLLTASFNRAYIGAMHKLREYRKAKKLTLEDMGALLGVSRNSVSRYERGEQDPTLPILERIVKVTGGRVKPQHFFRGEAR